jgi:hypothetical protein
MDKNILYRIVAFDTLRGLEDYLNANSIDRESIVSILPNGGAVYSYMAEEYINCGSDGY